MPHTAPPRTLRWIALSAIVTLFSSLLIVASPVEQASATNHMPWDQPGSSWQGTISYSYEASYHTPVNGQRLVDKGNATFSNLVPLDATADGNYSGAVMGSGDSENWTHCGETFNKWETTKYNVAVGPGVEACEGCGNNPSRLSLLTDDSGVTTFYLGAAYLPVTITSDGPCHNNGVPSESTGIAGNGFPYSGPALAIPVVLSDTDPDPLRLTGVASQPPPASDDATTVEYYSLTLTYDLRLVTDDCDMKVAHDVFAAAWQNPNDEEDRNGDYLEFELRTFWCSTPAGIRIIDIEAPKGRTLRAIWKRVFIDPAIEAVFTLHDEWRNTRVSQQLDGAQATVTASGKWETCMGIPFLSMGPRALRALATLFKRIQKSDRFPAVVRATAKQIQSLLRKAAFLWEQSGERFAKRVLRTIFPLLDALPRSAKLKITEALWWVLREWELTHSFVRSLFWNRWAKVPITRLLGDVHCSESWKPKITQTLHADGTSEGEFVDADDDNPMWEWRRTGGSIR